MPEDLTRLKDGGIIDEESLPENLKGDKCHNYTIVKIEKKLVNSSTTHKLGFSNNFKAKKLRTIFFSKISKILYLKFIS
jgi:hypothetical protein